jgi:thioredoxin 1
MAGFQMINEDNFDEQVLQSKTPVLLEFGAVWCKPCKTIETFLHKLAQGWGSKVLLAKLDVDESPDLAIKYGVMTVPSILFFINGELKERMIGLTSEEKISKTINPYL